jgi:hypothetical protein
MSCPVEICVTRMTQSPGSCLTSRMIVGASALQRASRESEIRPARWPSEMVKRRSSKSMPDALSMLTLSGAQDPTKQGRFGMEMVTGSAMKNTPAKCGWKVQMC